MLVGSRFRPAVKAVGVADPVGPIHVDAAPLMAPLVLVDVLIGDPQDIQAEAGGPGASRAGGLTQHKVAVGVTVMCRRGGIWDAVLRQPPQFRRDAIELLFPAHSRIRGDDLHRGIVGFGELDVRKVFPNAFQVCQLLYGHRREIWRIKRNGFPQGCICHAADDGPRPRRG